MKKISPILWFGASFAAVLSAKLLLIDRFGSSLPFWDQWAEEAWALYIPWFEGRLRLTDLFAAHCEHRIFVNRIISLALLLLNGQWDARLGMMLNAFITAGTASVLSWIVWRLLGRQRLASLCLFNTVVFALPYSWECTLLGFTGNYLLVAFAVAAVRLLTREPALGAWWFVGFLFALLSLATMGSGFCAALAAASIMALRVLTRSGAWRRDLIALLLLAAVSACGWALRAGVPGHASLLTSSAAHFASSLIKNMAWPAPDRPWTALVLWLPFAFLCAGLLRRKISNRPAAEFIAALGVWTLLQDAALAFARADAVTSRHTVFLALSFPINFAALLVFAREGHTWLFAQRFVAIATIAWSANAIYALSKAAHGEALEQAASFKQHLTRCEKNVAVFLETDSMEALTSKPPYEIPFPSPDQLAIVLRDQRIRAILPECVAPGNPPGPLSRAVAWLAPKGDEFLLASLALLIFLSGIRFYQSLGTLERQLFSLTASDARRILAQAAVIAASALALIAVGRVYARWTPHGLEVVYFRGMNFEEKVCSRTEMAVCRDYGARRPALGVPREKYSALWQGGLRVPETAEYSFFAQSDDGLRLIIDGRTVIDNWRDQSWGASASSARVPLTAGDHAIAVEYYNNSDEGALRIKWAGGPVPPNTILAAPYLLKPSAFSAPGRNNPDGDRGRERGPGPSS